MADPMNPRVRLPVSARKGEVIEIKTLVQHPMETGLRKDAGGTLLPRSIVNRLTCRFNGRLVFEALMEPAIAENPYLVFHFKAGESGSFEFTWTDDNGATARHTQNLAVT